MSGIRSQSFTYILVVAAFAMLLSGVGIEDSWHRGPLVGVAVADTVRILLGGHMYGLDGRPALGFQAGVDTFASFDPVAYVAGGDITQSGSGAQWDSVFATFEGKWNFPFMPVMGNHDKQNQAEWTARFGDTYYRADFGSTRLLVLDSIEYPNNSLLEPQLTWLLSELDAARVDPTVETVLLAQHHLFWIKAHPRYELMYVLGNAWYDDFATRGYDVNHYFELIWPKLVELAGVKPVTVFAGDTGWTAVWPGLFYDVLDGVTLLACGYVPNGAIPNDSVILHEALDGQVRLQVISPWGFDFRPLEDYGVDYWNGRLAGPPSTPLPFTQGPNGLLAVVVKSGTFEMGDHVNPRTEAYQATTGYTVTLSDFVMSTREVTVSQFLAFLNQTGSNSYAGVECVDLEDPECQILFDGFSYTAKHPSMFELPVIEVTWNGALGYSNYLSARDGLDACYAGENWDTTRNGWRLPTEAEFEFALRGGEGYRPGRDTYFRFAWEDNSPDHVHEHANYYGTGGLDQWESLAPVGSFPPNQYGIYDLCGNAFEWVYDPFTWKTELNGSVINPVGPGWPANLDTKTLRGGGFNFHWQACRNGYRGGERQNLSNSYIGFRVVRSGIDVVTGAESIPGIAKRPMLLETKPNPFNPRTEIRFEIPRGAKSTSLVIYDARGRRVRTLLENSRLSGSGSVIWDGTDDSGTTVPSGSYHVLLLSDGDRSSRKLSLIR